MKREKNNSSQCHVCEVKGIDELSDCARLPVVAMMCLSAARGNSRSAHAAKMALKIPWHLPRPWPNLDTADLAMAQQPCGSLGTGLSTFQLEFRLQAASCISAAEER